MKKFDIKKLIPHVVAIIVFVVVAAVYCKPAFQDMVVNQHDTQGWLGMAQQSFEFEKAHGHYPLWTNSMFSGMPAYQIMMSGSAIHVNYFYDILTLGLPKPVSFFFLACLGFYFLCLVMGASPWLAVLGGLSYAYSTFDPIIVSVGHDTQMISLGFAPFVIGGLALLFKRKYWWGFALTTLFSALLINQNHVQIVYYTLIIAIIMSVAFLITSYRSRETKPFFKAAGLAVVAAVIGLACSAVTMFPTYDYAKESMRGGRSELTLGDSTVKTKGGLDKDYAFRYSLGVPETFTFLVPALYGGSNGGNEFSGDTKFANQFSSLGLSADQAIRYENAYSYWGEQPGTSGPVYLGAVICLLFILGVVYLKGWVKWWLIASSAVGIILAYGSNFSSLNFFLFDHLPFYNKFRAPTMALVIPQFCFPLMGVLAVEKVSRNLKSAELLKKLKLTGIISLVLMGAMALFYLSASFEGPNDKMLQQNFQQGFLQQVPPGQQPPAQLQQQASQMSANLINALQTDRKDHMGKDLLRTIILMGLAWGVLYLMANEKIRKQWAFAGLVILSAFDLIGIAGRYLNESSYVDKSQFESAFNPTPADLQIMKDPDHNNFRVFNQTVDSFNDASTSYHHNSVGGYHPAKLALYNDLILYQLSKGNMEVFDMLNTRYFIVPDPQTGQPEARLNPGAFGNVWLVKGIKTVPHPNEEMLALDNTDLKDTAVVEQQYMNQIKTLPQPDSAATIKLDKNENDNILYSYNSNTPQVAVFSEIYYPRGWNAFIDGKPADYFRTDYVLRGMYLPAGKHEIEFRFQPTVYTIGRTVSLIASLLTFLFLIGAIFLSKRKADQNYDLVFVE